MRIFKIKNGDYETNSDSDESSFLLNLVAK